MSWFPAAVHPLQQSGFKSLLSLAVGEHLFAKVSGFYRSFDDLDLPIRTWRIL